MKRVMRPVFFVLFVAASLSVQAQEKQTFTGVITDEMCPLARHAEMKMGPTDAECTKACIMLHGSDYVLFDGKKAYVLSDQETPERFAGQKVRVVGRLNEKTFTIQVD